MQILTNTLVLNAHIYNDAACNCQRCLSLLSIHTDQTPAQAQGYPKSRLASHSLGHTCKSKLATGLFCNESAHYSSTRANTIPQLHPGCAYCKLHSFQSPAHHFQRFNILISPVPRTSTVQPKPCAFQAASSSPSL